MFNKNFFAKSFLIILFCIFFMEPALGFSLAQTEPAPLNLQGSVQRLNTIGKSYGGTSAKSLPDMVGGIIQIALTLLGIIFLILTVYGGYKWMIARGEVKEVETAKDIITRAVIGLIIVLAAYAITYFVVASLTQQAGLTVK